MSPFIHLDDDVYSNCLVPFYVPSVACKFIELLLFELIYMMCCELGARMILFQI